MRVVLADDSIPFDGFSPASQPLGGPEKAFASLPTALAMRGHDVSVINHCAFPIEVHDAQWLSWEGARPDNVDALIAFRHPRLLDMVPNTKKRIVWAGGSLTTLDRDDAREALNKHRPLIVFVSRAQREAWPNPMGLETIVMEPGLDHSYLEDAAMDPAEPPVAITTAHPLAGLDLLLKIWSEQVRPEVPNAELHVYSALLDHAQQGGGLRPGYQVIFEQVKAASAHGVIIKRPQADAGMADAYRRARVFLHPGSPQEMFGYTLAESQAAGLPAAVRATNAALLERVADTQTGTIAASDTAFASAAINLLTDRATFDRMSANARLLKRGRTWAVAAAEWEERFA